MAIHTSLPIYKLAYDLLSLSADLVKNMPRDFKSSFGRKINDECVDITVLIARANAAQHKFRYLQELLERLQVAELLIRLAHDKRFISQPQYAKAIEVTQQIGRQATGWKKSSARPQHGGQGHHA
ncbi:four helix bundle protein [Pseudoduganella sp. RAF19]|uniref:four helix bundle protein n=1 Tax=Bacteria TaxID=2 RepID=UPI003F9AF812